MPSLQCETKFDEARVADFYNRVWPIQKKGALRLGQAFHTFMNLDRCVQDKTWFDRLYYMADKDAKKFIEANVNYTPQG